MKRKKVLALAFVCFMLVSCATTGSVKVTGTSRVKLFPLDVFDQNLDEYVLFEGSLPFMGQSSMQVLISCDGSKLENTLLMQTGQTFAVIEYDGKKVVFDSPFANIPNFIGSYFVFDVELCYGNADRIGKLLKSDGFEISQSQTADGFERTILNNGKLIYKIEYENNICKLQNYERNYSYCLEKLN